MLLRVCVTCLLVLVGYRFGEKVLAFGSTPTEYSGALGWPLAPTCCKEKEFALCSQLLSKLVIIKKTKNKTKQKKQGRLAGSVGRAHGS